MHLKKYHIHFIGIGGIGMSAVAKLLLELGYTVSGSDINSSKITKKLKSLGGIIFINQKKEQVEKADLIVISSAITSDNVEVQAAITKKIPLVHRADILSRLMQQKYSIAVSGTHGKTSTTALIGELLINSGFDPTIALGGILKRINSNAVKGKSKFMIAETDESDGSLLKYSPTIAIITNIDLDHLDFYKNIEEIKKTFLNFINQIPHYGMAILCSDDINIQDIIPKINKKIITYGINSNADLQAKNISFNETTSNFNVFHLGIFKGQITLNMPGIHNIYNALAAIIIGVLFNITFKIIKNTMQNTSGVSRRMELKGKISDIIIIDDYAHHPTEILATLSTINSSWNNKRKIVVFQPHRYSRTECLLKDFSTCFYHSDILIILPIYNPNEKLIEKKLSKQLYEAIKKMKYCEIIYSNDFKTCIKKLKNILKREDLLITLGAGNVYKIGEAILKSLSQRA